MDSNFRFPAMVSFVVVPFRGVPPASPVRKQDASPFIMSALDDAGLIFSVTRLDAGVHLLINSDYRNDIETHELFASDVIPHFA